MVGAPRCRLRRENPLMALQHSLALVLLLPWPTLARSDEMTRLPNTEPLTWQGDLSEKMMDGLHRYIERQIEGSVAIRLKYWKRDVSSPAAYDKSVQANRDRFKQ